MSKQYEIDKAGHILNSDNKFEVSYDNGLDCAGVEIDELTISTAAGVCWLHLEHIDTRKDREIFCLNLGDQLVYVHVPKDGKIWLNDKLETQAVG